MLHDKMQQEFINVAAHELRTPIQPILSLTQILHSPGRGVAGAKDDLKNSSEQLMTTWAYLMI
jgi:signal transduction histidine kinase